MACGNESIYTYRNYLICQMANAYISQKNATLRSIAKEFSFSYGSVQKFFAEDLEYISYDLFRQVNAKKAANIAKSQFKCENPIIKKIKKVFRKK